MAQLSLVHRVEDTREAPFLPIPTHSTTQLDRPEALGQATPSRCFLVPCLPITINPIEQSLGWASALMFCPGFIDLTWGTLPCTPAFGPAGSPSPGGGVRWTLNPTLQLCWGPAPGDSYPLIYPLLEWYLKGSGYWDTHDSARVYFPEPPPTNGAGSRSPERASEHH